MLELKHSGAATDAARLPLDAFVCTTPNACGSYLSDDAASDMGAANSAALVVAVSYA